MPYLVRPRVVQSGPREFIVAVYVLDNSGGKAVETHFIGRVERTGTRARRALEECLKEILDDLRGRGGKIQVDDSQAKAVLQRVK